MPNWVLHSAFAHRLVASAMRTPTRYHARDDFIGSNLLWCSLGGDTATSKTCRARSMVMTAELSLVSRPSSIHTAMRNYTGEEGFSSATIWCWSQATASRCGQKAR